ncbi:MAG: transglycosylase SLT domain-containing protein [Lachnospiraceae bacterium]|nr:transglycosylase SLT domain-containing protein [Lachnospiraceae bacterium]
MFQNSEVYSKKIRAMFFALPIVLLLAMSCVIVFSTPVQAANKKTVDCTKQSFKVKLDLDEDEDWEISSNVSWLKAKQVGSKLKIYVSGNTKSKKRTGKITVKTEDKTIKYKVTQKKYDAIVYNYDYDWLACAKRYNKKDVTKKFLKKVAKVANKLGVDADDLMTVMAFESSLNHKAVNPNSGATGLIQFLPSTALRLGTTTKKLKKMSAVEQMDYVYKYLAQYSNLSNLGDLYMAILWPTAVGKKDSYVLWRKTDPATQGAYERNCGLDVNNDGKVTRKECLKRVLKIRKSYVGE